MALSKEQTQTIIALVKGGGLSNVQIAKQVGCSESAVRTTIKKNGTIKNEIKNLAEEEVQSIIIQDDIKTRKNELTRKEREVYDEVFIDLKTSLGIFNTATVRNQMGINKIQDKILKRELTDDDIYNLGSISKITETNRKQILGATETYKPEQKQEDTTTLTIADVYKKVNSNE